jgi:type I restriction enzyme S subunit
VTKLLPLKRAAYVRFSSVDKKAVEGEVPVRLCNYTDVYYHDSITPDLSFMEATATPNELRTFSLRRGDVLITKDSESPDDIAIPAYVPFSDDRVLCGYHLAQIRPDAQQLDARFLFWWMASDTMREELSSRANGITRFGLKLDSIAAAPVRLPRMKEQREIADFLDRETAHIDALKERKHAMARNLQERAGSARDVWVDDLFAKHGKRRLRRDIATIEQGWSPQCDNQSADGAEWGVLKTSAVSTGVFKPAENKRLPLGVEPDLRWAVHDGDLLVTRGSGSIKHVGMAAVTITDGRRLTMSDLTYRVVLDRGKPRFVAEVMKSSCSRAHIESSVRTDVGQTLKIRAEDLKEVLIPDVPEDQQLPALDALHRRLKPIDGYSKSCRFKRGC